jgi:hypothetical protein
MLRRIALTLIPCVALYTVAPVMSASPTSGRQVKTATKAGATMTLAAKKGYTVASS